MQSGRFYLYTFIRRVGSRRSAERFFAAATLVAISAFLIDFISPATPIPLALETGKIVIDAVFAPVKVLNAAIALVVTFPLQFYKTPFQSEPQPLDFECLLRC